MAQQNDVWTIRGDAGAEMTLRTAELIIDGALCASVRKNNTTLASKQFLARLMVVWMRRQSLSVCF